MVDDLVFVLCELSTYVRDLKVIHVIRFQTIDGTKITQAKNQK